MEEHDAWYVTRMAEISVCGRLGMCACAFVPVFGRDKGVHADAFIGY